MYSSFKNSTISLGYKKSRSSLVGNSPSLYNAMEAIATVTGNGSASTLTFSSIPSSYASLQIRYVSRNVDTMTGTYAPLEFTVNSINGVRSHWLYGSGSAAAADYSTANEIRGAQLYGGSDSNTLAAGIVDFHDYAKSGVNKTLRIFAGSDLNGASSTAGPGTVVVGSVLFTVTDPINSITIRDGAGGPFSTLASFNLFGIKG